MKKRRKKRDTRKPKKRMTPYNFFFQEIRPKILESSPSILVRSDKSLSIAEKRIQKEVSDRDRPSIESKKKRIPVIIAGKISFDDLAKEIGKRWKTLSTKERAKYEEMAIKDSLRYQDDLKIYEETVNIAKLETSQIASCSEDFSTCFPCRARKVADDHKNGVNAFLVPIEGKLSHGIPMICSHTKCKMEGAKFLYCAYCRKCSAKHHFRFNHVHEDTTTIKTEIIKVKEQNSEKLNTDVNPYLIQTSHHLKDMTRLDSDIIKTNVKVGDMENLHLIEQSNNNETYNLHTSCHFYENTTKETNNSKLTVEDTEHLYKEEKTHQMHGTTDIFLKAFQMKAPGHSLVTILNETEALDS